eukprot:328973_1
MAVSQVSSNKLCQSCHREFSVFIRPHSCELCNQSKLCSNCARKFILSYQPNPTFLRLCNKCCEKISRGNQLKNSSKLSKNKAKNNSVWSFASSLIGSSKSLKQSKNSSTNPLKDQAPLFPDNYNLSTPQRKEKQNIIFRNCIDSTNNNNQQNINIDDENNSYRTMHPLNNLKLKPPKSILFNLEKTKSKNQFALNVSINRDETQYYIGNLDNTSLCDCFLQNDTHDDNITDNGIIVNKFCYCIIVYIKHRIFKRLRIDLLFNESKEQYISMNVCLYDNTSKIWSGVSIVEINKIKPYKIVSKLHVECNQTLIKKSVTITGSMSWIIDSNKNETEYNHYQYPYKGCNISQMISVLTQQRFDIIDSYSTVIQQRNELNNLLKSDRKNQIHSIEKNENPKLYPHQISQEDGGSNGKPTKRNVTFKNENNQNKQNKECDHNISELEKSMFQHEIARIDSMILGLENTLYAIQNNTNNNKQKKMEFDEITSSVASSFMLHTNEINKQKLEIADHLHNGKNIELEHIFNDKLTTNKKQNGICDNIEKNKSDVPLSNVPVCFLCQRCSRTIILCQKIEDR